MFRFSHIAAFYRLAARNTGNPFTRNDCRDRAISYDWLSSRQSKKLTLHEISFTLEVLGDMN